jgi:hypothetical protein
MVGSNRRSRFIRKADVHGVHEGDAKTESNEEKQPAAGLSEHRVVDCALLQR